MLEHIFRERVVPIGDKVINTQLCVRRGLYLFQSKSYVSHTKYAIDEFGSPCCCRLMCLDF